LFYVQLLIRKKKVFPLFIDFEKCFDILYRNGIWLKWIEPDGSYKVLTMQRCMHNCVKSYVRANGSLSDNFKSYKTRGTTLTFVFFIFFVNDMYEKFQIDNVDTFSFDDIQIFLLLIADDTVLFSGSKEGLQCLLNKLIVLSGVLWSM
jgi:hypothetical protein